MNKTAVFTSLTMLLSVAQYGFAAESLERMQEFLQPGPAESASSPSTSSTERYLEEAKHRITPDSRWRLEHVLLPSIKGMRGDLTGVAKETTVGLKGLATLGSAAYSLKKVVLALSGGPMAATAAALTSPVALSAASAVGDWHQKRKISEFAHRPHSTPVLKMNLLGGRSNLGIESANSANPTGIYFDMESGRATSTRGAEKPDLSKGGIEGEGESMPNTQWKSSRKKRGKFAVTIEYPNSYDGEILTPEISIWKCHAHTDCLEYADAPCPKGICSVHQQTLASPPNLRLVSFAPSISGEELAVGFTNGTVGILHMDNEIYPGEGWSWTEWFEQNKAGGKPLFQYIQDHQDFLREVTGKIDVSDIGTGAAAAHVAGQMHPAAGFATAAAAMALNAHAKNSG